MTVASPDFTENTKKILAKMASERCCLCEEITSMPNSSNSSYIRIGEAAHISGARKSSDIRFNENLTNEERRNIKNGIWLCSNCHTIIDQDEKYYTVAELEIIRNQHYQRIRSGRYSKSSFTKIDELNVEIAKLNQRITEKETLDLQNNKIFQREITELRIKIHQINHQKEKLWEDYSSILQNLEQADNFEKIYKLVFEENNLELALVYLSDENLEKDAIRLAQKFILKADIFKLQNKKEAEQYYKKAYSIHKTFNVAKFYIRYLHDIRNFKSLIQFIKKVLETELKIEDRIALNGQLGTIYSKIDPIESAKYYKIAITLIDQKIEFEPHYYTLKAGFLNYLAATYKNNSKLQEALSTCEESLTIFLSGKIPPEERNLFYELASLYNTIARIYILNQNYSEAEKYLHLAINIASEKIKDEGELLATIYLNYCSLFETAPESHWKTFVEKIDHTIRIFSNLFERNPLQFVEKLVVAHCRKADFSFALKNLADFKNQLSRAENISEQFVKLNQRGFEFLLAEVHMRKAAFCIFKEDLKSALLEVDKALLRIDSSEFNDVDTNSKYASLALLKCRLSTNLNENKKLLINVRDKMLPFVSSSTTTINIYNEIEEELNKL